MRKNTKQLTEKKEAIEFPMEMSEIDVFLTIVKQWLNANENGPGGSSVKTVYESVLVRYRSKIAEIAGLTGHVKS